MSAITAMHVAVCPNFFSDICLLSPLDEANYAPFYRVRKLVKEVAAAEDETKGPAGMKWETFVKVLTDMGFTYDPSTAGSSVRFDPPDGIDRPGLSDSVFTAHPDSTITRVMLKQFGKKLHDYYGWSLDDIMITDN
ncbi:hypothetical protein BDP27DRAFT_1513495 [Rhodocollybia butyracea]|uniref:Uncharacterized protein n=1 Tax=Rhodocollybia butyracea TaxID=206335 RepID=A0A9P5PQ45_9AGAR|nr:hypothetical protein BDP27DRAFT_1513495 [Rhodocollybia butyracea]